MKVGRLYREKMVSTIKNGVEKKNNAFVVNYRNISSGDISALRKTLQGQKAKMVLSKGTLARIALKDSALSFVSDTLKGHTAFVWSDVDPVQVSKVLVNFAEKNETFAVRGAIVEGNPLKQADVKRLSDLPAKEVLVAQLLGTLQAPITRLARALNGKTTELILILKQLSEKKGGN